jgi:hypothetical protein
MFIKYEYTTEIPFKIEIQHSQNKGAAAFHEHKLSAQVHTKQVSQVKQSYNYQAFINIHP